MKGTPMDEALRFGGFVLAHAAAVASTLEPNDLICPFAVVTKGANREVLHFEADSQAEAVERGKASLAEYKEQIDKWGFAREGLWSGGAEKKVDVLLVSAWIEGMNEPINLMQRFRPINTGHFALLGPIDIIVDGEVKEGGEAQELRATVQEGVRQHPKGDKWAEWQRQ